MLAIELLVTPDDRRRAERADVSMPGRITTDEAWRTVCRIADISRYGARLDTFKPISEGSIIWLTLPGGNPPRKARITWATEFAAGCKFDPALDDAAVTALVDYFGTTVEPERPLEQMAR